MKDEEIKQSLQQRLLPESDHEKPDKSEVHRFITKRAHRFKTPLSSKEWLGESANLRKRFLNDVYMKGLPGELSELEPKVEWKETIETSHGYKIRKLIYEGYPGMWIPALLYEPDDLEDKVPGVMNTNGHHIGGKAMDYKQARCINLVKRGMMALNTEFIGMGELSMNLPHYRIGHIDLCGMAGVGALYLAAKRGLDVLLSHPNCDPQRVAVTGLSGGGWQTIVLSSLDQRVRAIIPVAGHSPIWQRPSHDPDIGDLEQNPVDFCSVGDYDAMTALCAPRPTLLIYNKMDDCCFRSERTRKSIYEPVLPLFKLLGEGQNLDFYENTDPGTHNYEADNRGRLYRFLNRHFELDTPESDLPFEDELLSQSQLSVGIPRENQTLLSIAREAAKDLPEHDIPDMDDPHRVKWIRDSRDRLRTIIRLRHYQTERDILEEDGPVSQEVLRLGDDWSIPITSFHQEMAEIQILISDKGRRDLMNPAKDHLSRNRTVITADVFGTGESYCPPGYQMMVSAVGERPLGILTGQILSLVSFSRDMGSTIRLSATGASTSMGALCAAALEPDLLHHLHLDGLQYSLKRLIEMPVNYEDSVPLFCFGLLREFDIPHLLAMTEDLEIERPGYAPQKPVVPNRD